MVMSGVEILGDLILFPGFEGAIRYSLDEGYQVVDSDDWEPDCAELEEEVEGGENMVISPDSFEDGNVWVKSLQEASMDDLALFYSLVRKCSELVNGDECPGEVISGLLLYFDFVQGYLEQELCERIVFERLKEHTAGYPIV